MSKSLGNFVTIRDALQKSSPGELRYFFLTSHYRSPIDYSEKNLVAAKVALSRLNDLYNESRSSGDVPEVDKVVTKRKKEFFSYLSDDFNTPQALSSLFDLARDVNRIGKTGKSVYQFLDEVNSIFDIFSKKKKAIIPSGVKALAKDREDARKARNWKKADEIRKKIESKGFLVDDTAQGSKLREKN